MTEGQLQGDVEFYVHPSSYVDAGSSVGPRTCIWHFCHIQEGAQIGSDCTLGQNVYVGQGVEIGDGCKIQNNVSLYRGVRLEDNVFCGPSCVFTNDLFPRASSADQWECLRTLVKRGASIGANATIVCGNTIGENALVAAGAVVTEDVPANAVVMGVPARVVRFVNEGPSIK